MLFVAQSFVRSDVSALHLVALVSQLLVPFSFRCVDREMWLSKTSIPWLMAKDRYRFIFVFSESVLIESNLGIIRDQTKNADLG